jgi:hypothetical protein
LFTHPAAALAFKVGEATDVARVAAGGAAIAVPPIFMAVGSTDIAGTVGDTYVPAVDESPDPPATFCELEAPGYVSTRTTAATIALPPSPAESHVSRCARIYYHQEKKNRSHRTGALRRAPISFLRGGLFTINRSTIL